MDDETNPGDVVGDDDKYRDDQGRVFTQRQVDLGKRLLSIQRRWGICCLIVMVAISVATLFIVPLNTVLPYRGRLGGNGISVVVALAIPIIVESMILRSSFKKGQELMSDTSRKFAHIMGAIFIFGLLAMSIYFCWFAINFTR